VLRLRLRVSPPLLEDPAQLVPDPEDVLVVGLELTLGDPERLAQVRLGLGIAADGVAALAPTTVNCPLAAPT